MSQDPEQESFAKALREAASVFTAPDAAGLHGAAVRRGRQIRRRHAGAAVAGGTAALGMAALALALPGPAAGHGPAVAAAAGSGSSAAQASAAPGTSTPTYPRPTAAPVIRPGGITGSELDAALEYTLPSNAQVTQAGGGAGANADAEVVDGSSHSWYVQTAITIKSTGQFGTLIAVSVTHTPGTDTCSAMNSGWGEGQGTCSQSTLDGGKLLDEHVPINAESSSGVEEYFEWFSPAGYSVFIELNDSSEQDFAVTTTQVDSMLTSQVFAQIDQALPADACVGGTFSKPVDAVVGGPAIVHVRCSLDGKLYPSM